jgi:hypothetical protein
MIGPYDKIELGQTAAPTPAVIEQAVTANRWAGVLPDIRSEILRAKAQVEARVFRSINDGSATPEASHLAWLELHALDKMLKRFAGKSTLPQTIGETDNG